MNAPKNISTLIHITLGIGILLVVISAIMPIINTSKSDGFKNTPIIFLNLIKTLKRVLVII